MNWRPIETAPKDGTAILAYANMPYEETEIVRWHEGDKAWIYGDFDHVMNATRWMPLPPPPSTEPAPQDTGEFGEPWPMNKRVIEQEAEVERAIACVNLLAGHDLSQVVVVKKESMEKLKSALQYGCATGDSYTQSICREALASLNEAQQP